MDWMIMETRETINQVEAVVMSRQIVWGRHAHSSFRAVIDRVKRRSLFQKVIIANTILIAIGSTMGIYMAKRYFAGGELGFLFLYICSGVALSILINYMLVKLAFRPLDDVNEALKAIRGGHRGVRVPEINDDPQIEALSRSLNSMLNSLENQRKRAAASTIKAQEEERKRIARELHDETSQSLTSLVIGIRMVEAMVSDSAPEVRERLEDIKDIAHKTLSEVHTMAVKLRPSVLDDLGLSAGLRSYIKEFSENTGIKVDMRMLDMSERLSPELETVLYRVVQEALTNVARHSGAAECKVTLERLDSKIYGSIADNGCGFDPHSVMMSDKGQGLGLHGMKERVELVEGSLIFESRPDEGATISVEVPVESKRGDLWTR